MEVRTHRNQGRPDCDQGSSDGANIIRFPLDLIAIALFSVAIFYLAQKLTLDPERVRKYIEHAQEEEEESEVSEAPAH